MLVSVIINKGMTKKREKEKENDTPEISSPLFSLSLVCPRNSSIYDDNLFARVRRGRLSQTDTWVPGCDEVEELVAVLAHERFDVVTCHVVPLDAIVVKVVQYRQTRLVVAL